MRLPGAPRFLRGRHSVRRRARSCPIPRIGLGRACDPNPFYTAQRKGAKRGDACLPASVPACPAPASACPCLSCPALPACLPACLRTLFPRFFRGFDFCVFVGKSPTCGILAKICAGRVEPLGVTAIASCAVVLLSSSRATSTPPMPVVSTSRTSLRLSGTAYRR